MFKYEWKDGVYNLTSKPLNDYVKIYLGERAAKEGFPESEREQKRFVRAVMRRVAERLGNTPVVTRESYVSPAVIQPYLDGRTLDDFRPRHLRLVKARDVALSLEEQAMLSLLRSWRIRSARAAA